MASAIAKNVYVSKQSYIEEIKQHRGIYATDNTTFNTWKSQNGTTYLVPERKEGSGYQLGYALQFSDAELTGSVVPVREENITALGFPWFWQKFEPCDDEPRKITIILDSVKEKKDDVEDENFQFIGLDQEKEEVVTETFVQLVTVHSTTTIAKEASDTTQVRPTETDFQTITFDFELSNGTETAYGNKSDSYSESSIGRLSTVANHTLLANGGFELQESLCNSILGAAIVIGSMMMMM
ncbi:DEKNAAC105269 [Brettanomyces naardenensis]|uniref:DEKNAAC105269 n=1 Tax=Brettanomyces naardenensis TaxID=13370 RepID=A0A448YSW6_BRENA|nr:DEKNAAC105269 [Brettanomyces naardenensis]